MYACDWFGCIWVALHIMQKWMKRHSFCLNKFICFMTNVALLLFTCHERTLSACIMENNDYLLSIFMMYDYLPYCYQYVKCTKYYLYYNYIRSLFFHLWSILDILYNWILYDLISKLIWVVIIEVAANSKTKTSISIYLLVCLIVMVG